MIMISSKCLRTEFNGGLIDLCVLTGVSMRKEKLAKKKTGRQQKGSRYFYELDETRSGLLHGINVPYSFLSGVEKRYKVWRPDRVPELTIRNGSENRIELWPFKV